VGDRGAAKMKASGEILRMTKKRNHRRLWRILAYEPQPLNNQARGGVMAAQFDARSKRLLKREKDDREKVAGQSGAFPPTATEEGLRGRHICEASRKGGGGQVKDT